MKTELLKKLRRKAQKKYEIRKVKRGWKVFVNIGGSDIEQYFITLTEAVNYIWHMIAIRYIKEHRKRNHKYYW